MRRFLTIGLLFAAVQLWAQGGQSTIVINEVDSDNAGGDTQEFIELYGNPNTSLDGYVIVFFNGSSNQSYESYDLDGMSLNDQGFFVLGNAAVPNVDMIFGDGDLQNGPDAVALYQANGEDFPTNTPLTTDNLIDALVYDTNDSDDAELLTLLEDGQAQVDENAEGTSSTVSMSRNPDGGAALITETYVLQLPTPGESNVLQCEGAEVAFEGTAETTQQACVDFAEAVVAFTNTSSTADATYIYILTNLEDEVEQVVESTSIDLAGEELGTCRVYGFSYTGMLEEATVSVGAPISGVTSSECGSLSSNFVTIEKVNCTPPACDGGSVTVNGGTGTVTLCVNSEETTVTMASNGATEDASFAYVVTEDNGDILELVMGTSFYDFAGFAPGTCRIYGLSYTGELDDDSIDQGAPVEEIISTDCVSLSSNFVTVDKIECEISEGCTDLFFSEYVEGSSSNKALEIYNPTPFVVDLSNYVVQTYNDGSPTPTNTLNLSGTLAPQGTLVISNSNAAPPLLNAADVLSSVTLFNGNDATVLRNNGVAIDILGVIGANPGKSNPWEVNGGEGSLLDHTLVRQVTVTSGETDWEIASNQWDVYNSDTFTFLGEHSIIPCEFPESPTVGFATSEINVFEGNAVQVFVNIAFPIEDTEVEIVYNGGTATSDVDFVNPTPVQIEFPEGEFAPQLFLLQTTEDEDVEPNESIILQLISLSGAEVSQQFITINILDDDTEPPLYPVSDVSENDENFVADSLGIICELRGIVHGLNTNPGGLQFTLIDDTGGIGVFSSENDFDYTVAEGDSVHVVGVIEQFNGLTQIVPDTVMLMETGLDLYEPQLVGDLDESTESEIIRLKCFEVVDPTQWTNAGPGFNVELSDGFATVTMRIDADTDIYGTEPPQGTFSIIGIGSQFDPESPYDEGYQIVPRYLEDLSDPVLAAFADPGAVSAGEEVSFVNESIGGAEFLWNFGDGNNSNETNPTHTYAEDGSYTVTLTAFSNDGECSDQFTFTLDVSVGVNEQAEPQVSVFPNPATDALTVRYGATMQRIDVRDAAGRLVMSIACNNQQQMPVDVSTLSKGVYLLEVYGTQHKTFQRIVKR
jgi:hypothetical protein